MPRRGPIHGRTTITFFAEILFVLLIVLAIGALINLARSRADTTVDFVPPFVLFALGTWAVGTWMRPIGPMLWGVHWTSFLVAALLIGLLLAATMAAKRRSQKPDEARSDPSHDEEAAGSGIGDTTRISVGVFFWAFVAVAVLAIAVRYAVHAM